MGSFNRNSKRNETEVRISRLAIMLPGAVMLIIGLLTGLSKMSVLWISDADLKAVHSPAMIFGFIGSLIALERAVAIRKLWAFAAPVLLSVGVILTIFPQLITVGKILVLSGSVILLIIYSLVWKRQASIATAIQAIAAFLAVAAILMWLGGVSFVTVSPIAALFLVITIVGERVELGRVAGLTLQGERVGLVLTIALSVTAVLVVIWPQIAFTVLGALLIALVVWLVTVDIARSTVKARGATRYMAVCLLFGYWWLFVAGTTWMLFGEPKGKIFDIVTHSILLGFVMSMIMAHASVILPAVLRIKLPYRKAFYAPLLLLQLTLLTRVIGDVRDMEVVIQIGGIGNAVAIVLFLITAATSAIIATAKTSTKKLKI